MTATFNIASFLYIVFLVRILRNSVGHECFFKCWAIELVLERCIVSLLDRLVEVKPTYILLLSEMQSPKGHLNWYITLFFCKAPIEGGELFLMTKLEVLNLLLYIKSFIFLLTSVVSMFLWINVFDIFLNLIYNCRAFGYGKNVWYMFVDKN